MIEALAHDTGKATQGSFDTDDYGQVWDKKEIKSNAKYLISFGSGEVSSKGMITTNLLNTFLKKEKSTLASTTNLIGFYSNPFSFNLVVFYAEKGGDAKKMKELCAKPF